MIVQEFLSGSGELRQRGEIGDTARPPRFATPLRGSSFTFGVKHRKCRGSHLQLIRSILIILFACSVAATTATTASAQPETSWLNVDRAEVSSGDTIVVTASGMKPMADTAIVIDGHDVIGRTATDEKGNVSGAKAVLPIFCPPTCAGEHVITLDIDPSISTTITVRPPREIPGNEESVFCTTREAAPPIGVASSAGCNVGEVTVTMPSVGSYVFSIPTGADGGVVLVSAQGSGTVACHAVNWTQTGGMLSIEVKCIVLGSASGAPVASRMSLLWHRHDPTTRPSTGYYAYARVPMMTESATILPVQYSSTAGAMSVQRVATGDYRVRLESAPTASELHIQISPYGLIAPRCSLGDARSPGAATNVRCYDHAGTPVDSAFSFVATKDLSILGRTSEVGSSFAYAGGVYDKEGTYHVPFGPTVAPRPIDDFGLHPSDRPLGRWGLGWGWQCDAGKGFQVLPIGCEVPPVSASFITITSGSSDFCTVKDGTDDLRASGRCYESSGQHTRGTGCLSHELCLAVEVSMISNGPRVPALPPHM